MAPPTCASLDQRVTVTETGFARIEKQLESLGPMQNDLKEVLKSMQYFNEMFEEIRGQLAETRKEVQVVRTENAELKRQNEELTQKFDDLDQYTRRNNLIIRNVPERNGESTDDIVHKVAEILRMPISPDVIEASHRLPNSNSHLPKPIVARFTNRRIAENIISEARKKRMTTKDLGFPGESRPVFFGEHLSPLRQQLFTAALAAKKAHQWRFLWTTAGKILARRNEGDPVITIRTMDDVNIIGRA